MSTPRERLAYCAVGDWVDITRGYIATPPEKDGFWSMNCMLDGPTKQSTKCMFRVERVGETRRATRIK